MNTLSNTTDLWRLLGDPTRVRLLALLATGELAVAELVGATGLVQSRVSSHLGRLRDAGMLRVRRQGASTVWSLDEAGMPGIARQAWRLVQADLEDPVLADDARRLTGVLRRRAGTWAESVAGRMERRYSPGRTWESAARSLIGLARLGRVLDVGSGDGALAELLAARADSVTCLDISWRVMQAARRRAVPDAGLCLTQADMHALPFGNASFDQVLLINALSHAEHPDAVLGEAARVLSPGGDVVGVTLARHDHAAVAAHYDHVQHGFEPADLAHRFERAGFDVSFCSVTSRERRPPHFEIITVFARRNP